MAGTEGKLRPVAGHRRITGYRRAGLCLLTALPLATVAAASALAAETVQALRYGTSLYHYYQRDYFGAITELSAAQELEQLGPHTDGANLMLGGMALSYGMDRRAEELFRTGLQQPAGTVDADRAWFYLGKMAWQRGDAVRTTQALARMNADYDGALQPEAHYLRANAALARGDTAAAEAQREALPQDSSWRYYLDYNLAAARAAQGDWAAATTYFETITAYEPATPEGWALHDRSLTAAGYTLLAAGELEQSGEVFRRVRLLGPYSNRALLGYGWSAAASGDYLAALSPWQQLAARTTLDESARESLLAVPYAYTQLDRPGLALQAYRHASERYRAELVTLQQAMDAFRDQALGPLLGIEEEGDADWLFNNGILPTGDHSPYLRHLVGLHNFQVALRELRDLYAIAGHLERAKQRLQVLQYVDTHQQQVWTSLVEEDRRNALATRQTALLDEQQALRRRLQEAIEQPDGRLLAGREQVARWARLERAAATAAPGDERIALLRGLLIWQDSENYPARAWQARRELRELDRLAAETATAMTRVDAAIASRGQSNFSPRIESLATTTNTRATQVGDIIARAESALRQIAIAEFERQGEQLHRALGQSQLAIAQIQDRAMLDANKSGSGVAGDRDE